MMLTLAKIWRSMSSSPSTEAVVEKSERKFGTFLGVFMPSILMLFGVIIFLRLGWIVGQVGLTTSLMIVTFAALIALITTLSMAAISTNIQIGKGGVYYMLSRSLGIEAGSAIGIPLFFRQSLTIAFCVIGFAESLNELVPHWSITSIGITTLGILTGLAYTSVRGALKVQLVIFISIIASLLALFTGSSVPPQPDAIPSTIPPMPIMGFWAVFAIYFPAMTGVESSVSLSGDLRNPSRSLPIGTISAILVAYAIYMAITLFLVNRAPIEQLANDPFIMLNIASIPSLIFVGIWGATLSSALGGLLGAPRTLQAIADDGIAPKIFGKTYGPMQEPRIATLATCLIALLGVYFGSVNLLAPLLTMISLICYAVLNLSAGIETLMANPSWRPRFRIHWLISISGAALCLMTMLMIDAGYAMLSLLLVSFIYFLVKKSKFQASWVDIRQGILFFFSRSAIYQLAQGDSSKSWRPHFLVFTKSSEQHSTPLMKFSEAIGQSKSFLTMASFVSKGKITLEKRKELSILMAKRFKNKKIDAFVQIKECDTIICGMNQMIEHYGFGPLIPNTIVLGGIKKEDKSTDFVTVLQTALNRQYNVVIMNDEKEVQDSNTMRDIHVWWHDDFKENSELMLVLAYMLQCNPSWKNTRICVKAFVEDELKKQSKIAQFEHIKISKRLPIDIDVYVSAEPMEEKIHLIKELSKNAGMVFLSLTPPPKEDACVKEYVSYLHTLSQNTENFPSLAFVLSSEHTPLDAILK